VLYVGLLICCLFCCVVGFWGFCGVVGFLGLFVVIVDVLFFVSCFFVVVVLLRVVI
jgi:hypothetical protein